MAINRNKLILAIIEAYNQEKYDTYIELLRLYYQLLSQEDINDVYLGEFTSYDKISDEALHLISGSVS